MEHWKSEEENNPQARPGYPSQEGGELSGGKAHKDTSGGRELYMNVRVLVSMMAVFVMVFTFVARIIVVSGPSMESTLWGGDLILVWGLGYTPKQGDIVVLTQENYQEDSIVKRVIATEGQRVDIDYSANSVRVDGELLEEDYIKEQMFVPSYGEGINHVTVPEGCLFVMGDNRNQSADSRYPNIGIVDRIFTRVGASDNISLGESTFMVEMNEAASILNNMSERSLILFDELGRGTSTYDGISIAWAIVEYIHEHGKMHPKTLFATHYHELNEMEKTFSRVVNYNVSVREIDGKVVFLRKLSRGGSEHSFGIHVAKLAGMPQVIVKRADEVLRHLESVNRESDKATAERLASPSNVHEGMQLSFFQLDDPVLAQLRDQILGLDINNLTPMAALNKLHDIRTILTGK